MHLSEPLFSVFSSGHSQPFNKGGVSKTQRRSFHFYLLIFLPFAGIKPRRAAFKVENLFVPRRSQGEIIYAPIAYETIRKHARLYWSQYGWSFKGPYPTKGAIIQRELAFKAIADVPRVEPKLIMPISENDLRRHPRDLSPEHQRFLDSTLKSFFAKNHAIVAFIDIEYYQNPASRHNDDDPNSLPVQVTLLLAETVAFIPKPAHLRDPLWQSRYDKITHSITWHIKHPIFDEELEFRKNWPVPVKKTNWYLFDKVLGISMPHDPYVVWKPEHSGWRVDERAAPDNDYTVSEDQFEREFEEALDSLQCPFSKSQAVIAYKGGTGETDLFQKVDWAGQIFNLENLYCPNFDQVPGALLSHFPECGCNFHIPAGELQRRDTPIDGTGSKDQLIEWPPMAIYCEDNKQGKFHWQWQHCPLRETLFMRFWLSRFFPHLMPLFPCILHATTSYPFRMTPELQRDGWYNWKEHRKIAFYIIRHDMLGIRQMSDDAILAFNMKDTPDVTPLTEAEAARYNTFFDFIKTLHQRKHETWAGAHIPDVTLTRHLTLGWLPQPPPDDDLPDVEEPEDNPLR